MEARDPAPSGAGVPAMAEPSPADGPPAAEQGEPRGGAASLPDDALIILPARNLVLFPGTLSMLQALKARNHWLGVATGKSRRGLDDALQTAQLRGVFDGTRTADETASKPDPRMLQELMREFGAEPERTLMIGDTTHDLQMAVNAGTPAIGVSYGAHEPDAFAPLHPLAVVHSTTELDAWLNDHA